MKDLFSGHAADYALYRPSYPDSLFEWIFRRVKNFGCAWDCGTGNGQVAAVLAKHFQKVEATDLSQAQLDQAMPLPNVRYQVSPAEITPFENHVFDLITVGQALHWFDFEQFNQEVKRIAKKNALLAVWGYGMLTVSPETDAVILNFYQTTIDAYWDPERKHVENQYADIPFPYQSVEKAVFSQSYEWTLDQLCRYLNTWSSVRKFEKANGYNPVESIYDPLAAAWGDPLTRRVTFPVFARLGEV